MQEYFPMIVQVVPQYNYCVHVYFDDGKIVEYDMSDKLIGVFEPLKDIDLFMESCTIMNDTLAFDVSGKRDVTNCIDIDIFTLYGLKAINDITT